MAEVVVAGSILIRPQFLEKATIGHKHNFDHATFVIGAIRVEELKPLTFNEAGVALTFETVRAVDVIQNVSGGNTSTIIPHVTIKAGTYHRLTPLKTGSAYLCIYSHQYPHEFDSYQGQDDEYDAALANLIEIANRKFGNVVQQYNGWQQAYQ